MIKAVISRNSAGMVEGFKIKGHAGYAEEGSDIICSAVSAIAYTALGFINENLSVKDSSFYTEKDGLLIWKRADSDKLIDTGKINIEQFNVRLDAVLEAMVIGLMQIRESYGTGYLSIQFEEVHSQC